MPRLVFRLDNKIGERFLEPNSVWLGSFTWSWPLPLVRAREEISQDEFQHPLPFVFIDEEIGGVGNKFESTVQRFEVWCERFEMPKVVLQKR